MNRQIENIRKTRIHLLETIKELSLEKLNKVPHGFNNNIIWNVGHLVAAQQGICYVRPGLPLVMEESLFNKYKMGSKPEHFTDGDEVDNIKDLLISTLDRFYIDYQHHLFDRYTSWTNRYGIEISSIEEAVQYLFFHEGLHAGVIMALKRLVQK